VIFLNTGESRAVAVSRQSINVEEKHLSAQLLSTRPENNNSIGIKVTKEKAAAGAGSHQRITSDMNLI